MKKESNILKRPSMLGTNKTGLSANHNLSLAGILLAATIIISPIQNEFKIITSITGLALSANLSMSELKNRREKVDEQKRIRDELNLKALELEYNQSRLEDDLGAIASIRSSTELELNILKEKQLQEIVSLEDQMRLDIANQSKKLEYTLLEKERASSKFVTNFWLYVCKEISQVSMSAIDELCRYRNFIDEENVNSRSRLAKKVKGMRSRVYDKKERESNFSVLQYEMAIDDAGHKINELASASLIAVTKFEEYEQEKNEVQIDDVNDCYLDIVKEDKKDLRESSREHFGNDYATLITDFNPLIDEVRGLTEEIAYLKGKLTNELKPGLIKKPRHEGDRKVNDFLNWLSHNWQIVADHHSSSMDTNRILTINFDLIEDQDKLSKKVGRLNSKELPAQLQNHFGSESEPAIGLNHDLGCWVVVIPPTRGGFVPELDDSKFKVQLPVLPAGFKSLEDEIKERIETQQTYEGLQEMMLNFVPCVPLKMPDIHEPSNQELNTLRWFFLWRKQAGKGENIVTIKGILREVYGLGEADGNTYLTNAHETLRDRISRLQTQLRIEMVDLNG